jgi:hypothetical protein
MSTGASEYAIREQKALPGIKNGDYNMSNTDSEADKGTQDAQSQSSDNAAGQRGSEPEYVTVEQFKTIEQKLEQIARLTQSEKDRAVKKTNERVDAVEGTLKDVLQSAAKRGVSLADLLDEAEKAEQAKFQQDMREMVESFKSGKFPVAKSQGSDAANGVNVSEVLKELELDLNDTRVKEFAAKQFGTVAEAYKEGAKLIKNISTRQPKDSDKPVGTSERAAAANKQEQLRAEYDEGAKKLRGQALINFKMTMRKKGLEIS